MVLRIVFMGTPDFSVPALTVTLSAGHNIRAVYTREPRRAGRGLVERSSPVHGFALKNGLPVFTPKTLKLEEEQQRLRGLAPDVIIVIAYGLLLPQKVLDIPPLGCLNIHASLLPRWRGAAPIQRAIMAGDKETGVMVMKMEAGLDTGPVAMSERISIPPDMTAGELHNALAQLGGGLLHRALAAVERGALDFIPQSSEGITYAHKIEKSESRIDWRKCAQDIHNQIRGLSPFPGAWFEINSERVKVLRSRVANGSGKAGESIDQHLTIACGTGAIQILKLQRAGKQPVSAQDFLRGHSVPAGAQLS